MKLKCRIKGEDYDIVSGATFSEEYNETLDSGSVIVDQISKIKDLKPYDDVFVWKADEAFNGYMNYGDLVSPEFISANVSVSIVDDEGEDDWIEDSGRVYVTRGDSSYFLSGMPANIWSSLYGFGIGDEQWEVDAIDVELRLRKQTDVTTPSVAAVGIYTIAPDASKLSESGILRIDRKSVEIGAPPSAIYVPINAFLPKTRFFSSQSEENAIEISNTASDSADMSGDIYRIESMIPPSSSVEYRKNTGARKKIQIAISGASLNQIIRMGGALRLPITIYGTKTTLICYRENINSLSSDSMAFTFKAYDEKSECASSDAIALTKGNDGIWRSDSYFEISVEHQPGSEEPEYMVAYPDDVDTANFSNDILFPVETPTVLPTFFKHLLADSFTCERINLTTLDKTSSGFESGLYKYKLDLMSETKRLEKTILPNISITQPISGPKRTVLFYLKQYVNLYSPKIKVALPNGRWEYRNKFKIDERLPGMGSEYLGADDEYISTPVSEIFADDIYAPEMSLTAPTLKDVLSRLMIVKDCIPVVRNDVIYAMKISDTHGEFIASDNHFSHIVENMSSGNYSTSFRREYGNAISQKNSTHMVEYMGFRNSSDALLTLDNMRLETRFPIYKINSLWLCFYKSISVMDTETNETYDKLILIRHDISKLVLQNEVRNALAADWTVVSSGAWNNIGIDEMSRWRVFTLGYSIGSNQITGWGEEMSYLGDPLGWTTIKNKYIEIILTAIDKKNPFGEGGTRFLSPTESIVTQDLSWTQTIVHPSYDAGFNPPNITDSLKSLFFKMDYIGMYSGAIIHSKEDVDDNDFQTADNCSSALTILEVDGLFEREKANRVANTETNFVARFKDVGEMNDTYNCVLGSYWGTDAFNGPVIYHREYQIFEDCVLANFVGTRDYVMKNYFTTVFAKYRTYSYASYSESVNRAENDRYSVLLSDELCSYDGSDSTDDMLTVSSIISAFSETHINETSLAVEFPNQINGGFFSFDAGRFFSDVAQFVSGYSLCFNIKMFDTVTSGVKISNFNCYDNSQGNGGLYIGAAQDWYKITLSGNDGFIREIGCYFGHFDDDGIVENDIKITPSFDTNHLFNRLFELPYARRGPTFRFGKQYDFCKDNKEVIDFTLQYELMNDDDGVFASEWLMKLTDFGDYKKFSGPKTIVGASTKTAFPAKFWSEVVNFNVGLLLLGYGGWTYKRCIEVSFPASDVESWSGVKDLIDCESGIYSYTYNGTYNEGNPVSYRRIIRLDQVTEVVRNNSNDVTGVKIRVQFYDYDNPTKMVSDISDVLFEKQSTSTSSAYVFRYVGQNDTARTGIDGNFENLLLENGKTADAPYETYGGIINDHNNKIYPQTMYIVTSDEEIEQSMVYRQFNGPTYLPQGMRVIPVTPSDNPDDGKKFKDVFELTSDEYGRPFIQFKANSILGSGYKSVQYWYYDAEGDGYMHFVFGVNKTKDSKTYISIEKSRSRAVYDPMRNKIGETMNFADDENADDYGKKLYVEVN